MGDDRTYHVPIPDRVLIESSADGDPAKDVYEQILVTPKSFVLEQKVLKSRPAKFAKELLLGSLESGSWLGMGFDSQSDDRYTRQIIPPDWWTFLDLDVSSNTAAGGGREFVGVLVFDVDTINDPKIQSKLREIVELYENRAASAVTDDSSGAVEGNPTSQSQVLDKIEGGDRNWAYVFHLLYRRYTEGDLEVIKGTEATKLEKIQRAELHVRKSKSGEKELGIVLRDTMLKAAAWVSEFERLASAYSEFANHAKNLQLSSSFDDFKAEMLSEEGKISNYRKDNLLPFLANEGITYVWENADLILKNRGISVGNSRTRSS